MPQAERNIPKKTNLPVGCQKMGSIMEQLTPSEEDQVEKFHAERKMRQFAATDEINRLTSICTQAHDMLLRGSDDKGILSLLASAWGNSDENSGSVIAGSDLASPEKPLAPCKKCNGTGQVFSGYLGHPETSDGEKVMRVCKDCDGKGKV